MLRKTSLKEPHKLSHRHSLRGSLQVCQCDRSTLPWECGVSNPPQTGLIHSIPCSRKYILRKLELSVQVKHLQSNLGLQVILTHGHLENAILRILSLRGVCVCVCVCVRVSTCVHLP